MRFLSSERVRKIYIIRTLNGFGAVFSVVGGSDGSFLHFSIVENIPENRLFGGVRGHAPQPRLRCLAQFSSAGQKVGLLKKPHKQ
jgi:hypothetical protein